MRTETKNRLQSIISIVIFVCFISATQGLAQQIVIDPANSKYAGEFTVATNKSQVLRLDQNFTEVFIGNSDIADVLALSDRTIYVLGKEIGSTSITASTFSP